MTSPLLAPLTGLGHLLGQAFLRDALLAGSATAALAGALGYFLVLRAQVFAADALSHVAYTGSLAALAVGADLRVGLFASTGVVGVGLGLLGGRVATDDVAIGTLFAWVLGLGVFFLSVYTTSRATADSAANVAVLFGSLFGVGRSGAVQAAVVAGAGLAVLAGLARPLLFATVDPVVAAARGVPVRTLGAVFLGLVGVAAGEATRVVGALLLLGLLAAPAAAAQQLTRRPGAGVAVSAALAVASVWVGVAVSYAAPRVPVSTAIVAAAATGYAAASVGRRWLGVWGRRR